MAPRSLGRTLSESPLRLDAPVLGNAAAVLGAADPRLGRLLEANGLPPLWSRDEGFPTLVKIILEQQVSLDSAAAAFANLVDAITKVEPATFLDLDDDELKTIGFSRQKAEYCRGIAAQLIDGSLELNALGTIADDEVRNVLTALKGIGPWTADVYLLFPLARPDVWPRGDRALVVSMAESLPLLEIPSYEEAEQIAQQWRPWRSVAARVLWHAYLSNRGRSLD